MFKPRFRPANPDSRIPPWLQNRTKENLIWQLKMTVLVIGAMQLKDEIEFRRQQSKNRKNTGIIYIN